ncbi:MAG: hypothetical protein M3160_06785 [Candidatus Eremiobacteraeota bacterium]|nr:hypothetical protein [Candidatus Eremiobacteraeota bacterium]
MARLEFSLQFPAMLPPPVISRFIDASEETLRARWEGLESQVDAALEYVEQIDARAAHCARNHAAFAWLRRNTKELDQYSRAVRWVLTVTERGTA